MRDFAQRAMSPLHGIYVDGWMLYSGDLSMRQLRVGDYARIAVRCTPVREQRPGADHRVQPVLLKRGEWRDSIVDLGFPAMAHTPDVGVQVGAAIPGDFWLMPLLETDVADLAHPTSTLQEYVPVMVQTWLIEAIAEQYAAYGRRGDQSPRRETGLRWSSTSIGCRRVWSLSRAGLRRPTVQQEAISTMPDEDDQYWWEDP
ncbi:hypothetical protein ACFFOS_27625, partial [Nocardioides kongjuensis]